MNRQQYGLARWCDKVVSYIYYTPDREQVRQELMWHLEDAAEALAEQGVPEEEIVERATSAMGDAKQLGLLLRRVHKPWLSWACWASVALAFILALVLLGNIFGDHLWGIGQELKHLFRPELNYENYYEHYSTHKYLDDDGNVAERVEYPPLVAEISPGGKIRCGVYTFQVTNGWIIEDEGEYRLLLVLSYSSPQFWTGSPSRGFFGMETSTGRRETMFDRGNMYIHWPSISETALGEFVLTLPELEPGTEWVEIFYDKCEGFDLRVYLPWPE